MSDSIRVLQRFTQRHEAIMRGSSANCGRQALLDLLAVYTSLIESLDIQCGDLVVLARQHGVSWAQIAIMLGITRQAAQQRYQPALDRAARAATSQAERR